MENESLGAVIRSEALGKVLSSMTSEVLSSMTSEDQSQKMLAVIRGLSDESLDAEAKRADVPEDQWPLYRAMLRNEPNTFMEELKVVDGLLKPGDIILMTNPASTKLVKAQQSRYYKEARSSHVALIHADFVCIDAMPKTGVTNRIISKLLEPAGNHWRVIRCKQIADIDIVMKACGYYLEQPYLIFPSKRSAQSYTYCSELARKVFNRSGVTGVGIADNSVIAPAHFDKLADGLIGAPHWEDVTEKVRPAVEFCQKYTALVDVSARLFIEGLLLNRKRFEKRAQWLKNIKRLERSGKISAENAAEARAYIQEINSKMNHTFWDVRRPNVSATSSRNINDAAISISTQDKPLA